MFVHSVLVADSPNNTTLEMNVYSFINHIHYMFRWVFRPKHVAANIVKKIHS